MIAHPPATDIVASLGWIMDRLADQEAKHAGSRVNATEAATALGYHPRYFHGRPWRIPGFGLSGWLHSLREWEAWNDRPEAERRAEWETMPISKRRNARGAA